jgi:DinB family protein
MERGRRDERVRVYACGFDLIASALAGLSDAQLDRRPLGGGFSAREVVHHMADSEMVSGVRLRRLLAEEAPAIHAYDTDVYAERLRYRARDIAPALKVIQAARAANLQILSGLDERDWLRAGTHDTLGPYTVELWLEIHAAHALDHAAQIQEAAGTARPALAGDATSRANAALG